MTLFWIIAALLMAAALAFVLPPLLGRNRSKNLSAQPLNVAVYRDQLRELDADRSAGVLSDEQYERARLELEQRLLEDVAADPVRAAHIPAASRVPALAAGVAVPLLAVALYFVIGNPGALAPVAIPKDVAKGVTPQQIEAMVAKLAERMKQNPDDAQGWAMLGKSYAVMGRFEDASAAYAKAVERVPDNPHVLTDYADALAMARGQSLVGEPEALVMRALKIDPSHMKALALAGTIAFEKKDYPGALRHWEKLASLVPPDSEMARGVQSSIAEARTLAGAAGNAGNAGKAAGNAAAGVGGTVTLAASVAAKAAPGDTVFIFARAADGPRMPLAIVRKKVSDLPVTFVLDDSMAMSPASKLSSAPQVIVGARISKSGNAMPQSGDLQGFTQPVSPTAQGLKVVIDTEIQ